MNNETTYTYLNVIAVNMHTEHHDTLKPCPYLESKMSKMFVH